MVMSYFTFSMGQFFQHDLVHKTELRTQVWKLILLQLSSTTMLAVPSAVGSVLKQQELYISAHLARSPGVS